MCFHSKALQLESQIGVTHTRIPTDVRVMMRPCKNVVSPPRRPPAPPPPPAVVTEEKRSIDEKLALIRMVKDLALRVENIEKRMEMSINELKK